MLVVRSGAADEGIYRCNTDTAVRSVIRRCIGFYAPGNVALCFAPAFVKSTSRKYLVSLRPKVTVALLLLSDLSKDCGNQNCRVGTQRVAMRVRDKDVATQE